MMHCQKLRKPHITQVTTYVEIFKLCKWTESKLAHSYSARNKLTDDAECPNSQFRIQRPLVLILEWMRIKDYNP